MSYINRPFAYAFKYILLSTGLHYVVEGDIKEFTNLKMDSVGRSLLTILRHCQRLKEVRGGGLTRYAIVI